MAPFCVGARDNTRPGHRGREIRPHLTRQMRLSDRLDESRLTVEADEKMAAASPSKNSKLKAIVKYSHGNQRCGARKLLPPLINSSNIVSA